MSRITARLSAPYFPWFSLAARIIGAAAFGWAALSKIGDPDGTVRAVRAYRLLPETLVGPIAHALPAFELVLAALLLGGLAVRVVGAVAAGALAVFVAAVASAGLRGLRIDCGCFGGGGTVAHTHYLLDIGRDAVLLLVMAVIPLAAHSRFSVDSWLDRRISQPRPAANRTRLAAARAAEVAATRRRHRLAATGVAALCLAGAVLGGNIVAANAGTPSVPMAVPTGATAAGGIWVGDPAAKTQLLAYEDPQCPVCGEFEKTTGLVLRAAVAAGTLRVEYRMRSFLGPESVRADNALAAAQDQGRFEELRQAIYAHQPAEHTGGFTTAELLALGRGVGLQDAAFVDAVTTMKYERWVEFVDDQASKDGNVGTPELLRAGGQPLTQQQTFDPGAFAAALKLS